MLQIKSSTSTYLVDSDFVFVVTRNFDKTFRLD